MLTPRSDIDPFLRCVRIAQGTGLGRQLLLVMCFKSFLVQLQKQGRGKAGFLPPDEGSQPDHPVGRQWLQTQGQLLRHIGKGLPKVVTLKH